MSKREPVLLHQHLETLQRAVVRVEQDLCQGDHLQWRGGGGGGGGSWSELGQRVSPLQSLLWSGDILIFRSDFQNPWTIVFLFFLQFLGGRSWSFYSSLEGAMKLKLAPFYSSAFR